MRAGVGSRAGARAKQWMRDGGENDRREIHEECCAAECGAAGAMRLASDKPAQLQPKPFQPRGRIPVRRDLLAPLRQFAGRQQMMVLAVRAINRDQA